MVVQFSRTKSQQAQPHVKKLQNTNNKQSDVQISRSHYHAARQSRKDTLYKVIIGLLFTFLISMFHYNSQHPDVSQPVQIGQKTKRVMELTLIKDRRVYKHETKPQMGMASYLPFMAQKSIEIRTEIEYSIGFDLTKARAHFDPQQNNVNIDFGQLQVLTVNILQQTINAETEGILTSWSRQQRNQVLKSSMKAIKKYIQNKANQNETYLEQLSDKIQKQMLKENHQFHLPRFYPTINQIKKTVKPYLDFFKPTPIKPKNQKSKKKIKQPLKQNQTIVQQYSISRYIPDRQFFSAGLNILQGKKLQQVIKK